MGRYVLRSLTNGETVAYEGKISIWSLSLFILAGLLLLVVFGLGLILWLEVYIRCKTTEFAITNKRVIFKAGLISRRTFELNLRNAEAIQVNQNLFGRIFDYGSILISGAGIVATPFHGISQPLEFRRAFLAAQEAARRQ